MPHRPLRWLLAAALLVAIGFVGYRIADDSNRRSPEAADALPAPLDIGPLSGPGYAGRFEAAMQLVGSKDEDFDARLEAAIGRSPEGSPSHVALEYIRWKRSGAPFPSRGEESPSDRPNVLLISIDTLRADHLGCYGYARPTSPNIDKLASEGVLFEHAFSTAPWTLPGHMSMFTSLQPSFHKLESRRGGAGRLDPSERTIGETLHEAGYRTAGFVTHPFLEAKRGFGRGFDLYFRHPVIVPAEVQTERTLSWLEWHLFHRQSDLEPAEFFLFVHYMDPHETYDAPPPFGTRFTGEYEGDLKPEDPLVTMFLKDDFPSEQDYEYTLALYDGEVSYVDHELGRLLVRLDAYGLRESTLIVLTSDHGEEFKERGGMGHLSSLHTEQLRVPLIFRYPPRFAAGRRVPSQASVVDIYPTIAGVVGEEVPSRAQGVDLRAVLMRDVPVEGARRSARGAPSPAQFGELGPIDRPEDVNFRMRSIRTNEYKLISDLNERSWKLYDVRDDPAERRDLYPSMRADRRVRALQKQLGSFIKRAAAYAPAAGDQNEITIDKEIEAQLRALGYLD